MNDDLLLFLFGTFALGCVGAWIGLVIWLSATRSAWFLLGFAPILVGLVMIIGE